MTPSPDRPTLDTNASTGGWRQIPALDGVRGLAALMVIVFHYYQALPTPANSLVRRLYLATSIGQTGVDLFFVLSGFLITGILLHAKGSPNAWLNFYARRALRIFPLYYFVLIALAVAVLAAGYAPRDLLPSWWYWAYLQNVPQTFAPDSAFKFPFLNPNHFWSLAVEEHFYLVWPAIVLTLPRRVLPGTLLAFVGVSTAARVAMVRADLSTFFFTLTRLDALSIGSLIAVLWTDSAVIPALVRWSRRILIAAPFVLGPIFIVAGGKGLTAVQFIKYPIQAIAYGALLVMVARPAAGGRPSLLARPFTARAMRVTGKYSYGLYVYHPFVIAGLLALLDRHPALTSPRYSPLGLVAAIALSYAAAVISWHLLEKHFLKLKSRFEYTEPPRPPSPGKPQDLVLSGSSS